MVASDGLKSESASSSRWLDSVEGEIAFFRALMRARPVGIHRHFHVLTMRNAILRDTGHVVSIDDLWDKLRACYDLEILENIETDGYDPPGYYNSPSPSAVPLRSPSPSENLSSHPWFRHEYSLPSDEAFDTLISMRRMRATASLPSSSPAASPSHHARTTSGTRQTKKGRSKLKNVAGLVGGDSDSSALTQESGDESAVPTPSLATGTDVGTDYADDEDMDGRDSPGELPSLSVRRTHQSIYRPTLSIQASQKRREGFQER
ncbi:uncharacterized protein LAESUDRAFT_647517 [Laetiporus sulphureus 93-53]|uniref:Chromatin modification-related protein EAF7 n=1 Tax=Laetiporus sulphureus 93-53 TaxID=1314785 RepID=A0A165FL31_9APHY|nr:uncharacterized protein LAESUDRAFT_647517 [Laetiporus sulphureus 93-53]KZT09133.1 hypothetical protein LAESUDRAFT_647517 [Laetiporus sulphureus 93-53]